MMSQDMWNQLPLEQKSAWMQFFLKNGVSKLEDMGKMYREYQSGGSIGQQNHIFINTRHPNNHDVSQYGNVVEREVVRDYPSNVPLYESSRFNDGTRMQVMFNPSGVNDTVVGAYPMPPRHINPDVFEVNGKYATYDKDGNPIWHNGTYSGNASTGRTYQEGGGTQSVGLQDNLTKAASDNNYFINDWLTQRSNILDSNAVNQRKWWSKPFYNAGDELNTQLNRLNNVQTFSNSINELPNMDKNDKLFENGLITPDGTYFSKNQDGSFSTPSGFYNPEFHKIYVNKLGSRDDQASAIFHEKTHALGIGNPQVHAISQFQKDGFLGSSQENNTFGNNLNSYNDTPWEIYARLMQFRHDNNIDPLKVWNIEEIQKLRETTPQSKEHDILNRYTDDFILHLFNDVAQNNNDTVGLNNYAQYGGPIITQYGQWAYPGQVTTIPSNRITMKGVNYPVLGVSDKGDAQLMMPNGEYKYSGNSVTEYPIVSNMFQLGGHVYQDSGYTGMRYPTPLDYIGRVKKLSNESQRYVAEPIVSNYDLPQQKVIEYPIITDKQYETERVRHAISEHENSKEPSVVYDSDKKFIYDNPNDPTAPFRPHHLTPKEIDGTLRFMKFLQPFDPTGLTGVPDALNSWNGYISGTEPLSSAIVNTVGALPAAGKVARIPNGTKPNRFVQTVIDTPEEVLGNLAGRIHPSVGNAINNATASVQSFTAKPAERVMLDLMQRRGTRSANNFADAWNVGASLTNMARGAEDVYDIATEDPLIKMFRESSSGRRFQNGGYNNDPAHKSLSEKLMYLVWRDSWPTYNDLNGSSRHIDKIFGSTPQRTYLMTRGKQRRAMLANGYRLGAEGDYGLARKAIEGFRKKNLPVYQTADDDISRDYLVPIGNVSDKWYGDESKGLRHAGSFPTAVYVDGRTGNDFYQKAWDLNNYGKDGGEGGTYEKLNAFGKAKANLLDIVGQPIVQVTGFNSIPDWRGMPYLQNYLSDHGLTITDGMITLPEVEINASKDKNSRGK